MITLYFYDNIIQYKKKEEIHEFYLPKNCMKYGKVTNIPIFEQTINLFVTKHKWNSLFKTKKILLILPMNYTESDKEIITVILNNVGLKEIFYKKESNFFVLKKNDIILIIHQEYLLSIEKKKNQVISLCYPYCLFLSMENTLRYFINHHSSRYRYFLLGNNSNIPNLYKLYVDKSIFYYYNYSTYIISFENT